MSAATITAPEWTLGPSIGSWFAENLPHVKGPLAGQPFVLHESQQADIDLIYECDADGVRFWRDVMWSVSKGYGKTPISGGIGLSEMMNRDGGPEVYIAAGSKDQAGICQDYARRMVDNGPLRREIAALGRAKLSPLKKLSDGGVMRPLAADGELSHGPFPSATVLDEMWTWVTGKQESMYLAVLSASEKVWDSLMLAITTVGARWATLLGELFETLLSTMELEFDESTYRLVGRDRETGRLLIWRTAPTARVAKLVGCKVADVSDPAVWRKCNPGPWITDRGLRRLAKTMPELQFRQFILNQWPDGRGGTLLVPADWDACGEGYERIAASAPVWLGVSVSPSRRDGALVIVAKRSDGRVLVAQHVHEDMDEDVLKAQLEEDVRSAAGKWDHQLLAADEWQFGSQMKRLAGDGINLYKGSTSGKPGMPQTDAFMVPATNELLAAVTGTKLMHDGDRSLRRHALGLETRIVGSRGARLARPAAMDDAGDDMSKHRKPVVVEAGFALAMALYAMQSGEKAPKAWAASW